VISKIKNIAFVGASTAEFLVACDYRSRFCREIVSFSLGRILSSYDPMLAHDPKASDEVRAKVRSAFRARVTSCAESLTVHENTRKYFQEWATTLGFPFVPPRAAADPDTSMVV
jgi:hypothetical protein